MRSFVFAFEVSGGGSFSTVQPSSITWVCLQATHPKFAGALGLLPLNAMLYVCSLSLSLDGDKGH